MNLQETIPLSDIYNREVDFSADLANNLDALRVGSFEDVETEVSVGTRRADIVAVGDDGTLVVENQFGRADWNHWGRLEAYARSREADVAVLVAEDFEELMIDTCNRCNEDSTIAWYLIKVQAYTHKELHFHYIATPVIDINRASNRPFTQLLSMPVSPHAIDIQTERTTGGEESEFWAPIRRGEFGTLFAGPPVSIRNEGWIDRSIRRVKVTLCLLSRRCYVRLYFRGATASERSARRERIMTTLFSASNYPYEYEDSPKETKVRFFVLDKGKRDRDHWDEIRRKLVDMGTDIYNTIAESNL